MDGMLFAAIGIFMHLWINYVIFKLI